MRISYETSDERRRWQEVENALALELPAPRQAIRKALEYLHVHGWTPTQAERGLRLAAARQTISYELLAHAAMLAGGPEFLLHALEKDGAPSAVGAP